MTKIVSRIWVVGAAALLVLTSPTARGDNGEYTFVKKEGVVTLYERWMPGPEPLREIQAVVHIRSDVASVIRLLRNEQLGTKWNSNTSKYQVSNERPDSWVTYIRYNLPWPMDDQDCCLKFSVMRSAEKAGVTQVVFEDNGKVGCSVNKGVSRITGTKGRWQIEEVGPGELRILYFVRSDRSSSMPRWVSDPFVHKSVFASLSALKRTLEAQ